MDQGTERYQSDADGSELTQSEPTMARLVLWIQPRASRTEVVGRHGDAIRIRIAAPPVDGAANEELVRFLAERLGVSRSAVQLKAGASGRRKTVEIAGVSAVEVEKRLGLTRG